MNTLFSCWENPFKMQKIELWVIYIYIYIYVCIYSQENDILLPQWSQIFVLRSIGWRFWVLCVPYNEEGLMIQYSLSFACLPLKLENTGSQCTCLVLSLSWLFSSKCPYLAYEHSILENSEMKVFIYLAARKCVCLAHWFVPYVACTQYRFGSWFHVCVRAHNNKK